VGPSAGLETNFLLLPGIKPRGSSAYPVTILTEPLRNEKAQSKVIHMTHPSAGIEDCFRGAVVNAHESLSRMGRLSWNPVKRSRHWSYFIIKVSVLHTGGNYQSFKFYANGVSVMKT
jgi:hypothetical protein